MSAQREPDLKIAMLVGMLAAAYPHAQITEETITVYEAALSDIPPDVLEVAVKQCLASSEFFPTVAKLRETALALTTDLTRQPTPFEAWGEVLSQVRAVGFYGEPQFSCALVARAVQILGWKEICLSENQVADRAHFVRVYEQLHGRAKEDAKMLPAAREMIESLAAAKSMNQLPPVPREAPGEAVPPTAEFIEALKNFKGVGDMPDAEEEVEH